MSERPTRKSLWGVFSVPVFLAVVSIVGLVSALTGDGWRDGLSWAALGAPLCVAAWAWARRN